MSLFVVSTLLVTLVTAVYIYVKYIVFTFWKRRGVPYAEPTFPFGNFISAFLKKKSFGENLRDLYNSSDAPILGIYATIRPALLIRDPKIIRDIWIKDFQSFWHRGLHFDETVDPLAANLFSQSGDKWKEMRTKLTPTFTTGKIKAMFGTIIDCGKSLENYLNKVAACEEEIEVRDIFARFTTNAIASIAFGIDIDCLENPNDDFRRYSGRFFEPTFKGIIRFNMSLWSPFLTKLFGVRFVDKDVFDFMKDTVRQNLEYREKNNVSRKDFFQLLMQLRNSGKLQDDGGDWSAEAKSNVKSLSLDEMTAQTFIFVVAGYESSSTTMSFCMYELARNPELQKRAYNEITSVLQKYDGKLTYESFGEMKYLDCCIDGNYYLNKEI